MKSDLLESQLKELIRRRFEDEITRVDAQSSYLDQEISYQNLDASQLQAGGNEYEQRPLSALLTRPQRQNLIQFALPINKAMRRKGIAGLTADSAHKSSEQTLSK